MYVATYQDLKYPIIIMKIHINTNDHKPKPLKPYQIALSKVEQIDTLKSSDNLKIPHQRL